MEDYIPDWEQVWSTCQEQAMKAKDFVLDLWAQDPVMVIVAAAVLIVPLLLLAHLFRVARRNKASVPPAAQTKGGAAPAGNGGSGSGQSSEDDEPLMMLSSATNAASQKAMRRVEQIAYQRELRERERANREAARRRGKRMGGLEEKVARSLESVGDRLAAASSEQAKQLAKMREEIAGLRGNDGRRDGQPTVLVVNASPAAALPQAVVDHEQVRLPLPPVAPVSVRRNGEDELLSTINAHYRARRGA